MSNQQTDSDEFQLAIDLLSPAKLIWILEDVSIPQNLLCIMRRLNDFNSGKQENIGMKTILKFPITSAEDPGESFFKNRCASKYERKNAQGGEI